MSLLPLLYNLTLSNVGYCSTITVMTSLVALSFYGASQLKFHWVERYDKLLVGSVLCLVGVLTLIFHDHDHDGHGSSTAGQLNRKLIVLWGFLLTQQDVFWESYELGIYLYDGAKREWKCKTGVPCAIKGCFDLNCTCRFIWQSLVYSFLTLFPSIYHSLLLLSIRKRKIHDVFRFPVMLIEYMLLGCTSNFLFLFWKQKV